MEPIIGMIAQEFILKSLILSFGVGIRRGGRKFSREEKQRDPVGIGKMVPLEFNREPLSRSGGHKPKFL